MTKIRLRIKIVSPRMIRPKWRRRSVTAPRRFD
jgi:hypothetical protein